MTEQPQRPTEIGLTKIAITDEANQVLEAMLVRVNEGSTSGRVGKRDLTSWVLKHFSENSLSRCMSKIRADHFDELVYLRNSALALRAARRNGSNETELRELATRHLEELHRRTRQARRSDYIPKATASAS